LCWRAAIFTSLCYLNYSFKDGTLNCFI
jgi:hypothetical protein